jgi:hypothetical protein
MIEHLLRTAVLAVGVTAAAGLAGAQAPQPSAPTQRQRSEPAQPQRSEPAQPQQSEPAQSLPKEPQNSSGQRAQETAPGQAGKEEPSSHATRDSDPGPVLVNGALNVPGASRDTQTTPAKFSRKNAESDRLTTLAHTLTILPQQEARAIYTTLKDEPPSLAFRADVGTKLPAEVELRSMPSELTKRVPLLEGYRYTVAGDRVMVVYPATRFVVAVYAEDGPVTTGSALHAR